MLCCITSLQCRFDGRLFFFFYSIITKRFLHTLLKENWTSVAIHKSLYTLNQGSITQTHRSEYPSTMKKLECLQKWLYFFTICIILFYIICQASLDKTFNFNNNNNKFNNYFCHWDFVFHLFCYFLPGVNREVLCSHEVLFCYPELPFCFFCMKFWVCCMNLM